MFIKPTNTGLYVRQPAFNFYADELFLNAFPFLQLLASYDSVDCICYTVDASVADMINLKRLIYNKAYGTLNKNIKKKQISNLHTKMYICEMSKTIDVFMGSWNLVPPTYLETVVKIPKKYNSKAIEYFNYFWNAT